MKKSAALVLLLALFPFVALATVTTIDTFEAYSTGNLNTQGGWSGSTVFQVETSVVQSGTKAVSAAGGATNQEITKSITAVTKGTFTVYMRTSALAQTSFVEFMSGATPIGFLDFRPDNTFTVDYSNAGGAVIGASYSANTWYPVTLKIDAGAGKMQASFNGGAYSTLHSVTFTSIDGVRLHAGDENTGGTYYYDNISFDDGASAVTSSLWQFFPF